MWAPAPALTVYELFVQSSGAASPLSLLSPSSGFFCLPCVSPWSLLVSSLPVACGCSSFLQPCVVPCTQQVLEKALDLKWKDAAAAAKSLQSCPTLCDSPQSAAHQALPSLGFSRQEHWSGLPLPSPWKDEQININIATSQLIRERRSPLKLSVGLRNHLLALRLSFFVCKMGRLGQTSSSKRLHNLIALYTEGLPCAGLCNPGTQTHLYPSGLPRSRRGSTYLIDGVIY